MSTLRILQIVVVALGVLLLAGVGIIAATILTRVAHNGHIGRAPAPVQADASATDSTLDLPPGTAILSAEATADRLTLHVRGPSGEAILIVEPQSGRIVHRLAIPGPAPSP